MEKELAQSIVADEHLKETPSEDKYGRYELSRDYVANGQIMVTITLAEYRELLYRHAERERDELKKQVDSLEKELASLKCMIASAVPMSGPSVTLQNYRDTVSSAVHNDA